MCSRDEEMTLTHKLSCTCERISPDDVALCSKLINFLITNGWSRTYAFDITSDNESMRIIAT